jgi:LEA14-like dessication related protein
VRLRHARLLLVAAALAACAGAPRAQSPAVTVESVRIDRLTAADAEFAITLAVTNPDAAELSVDEARADLRVEDVNVGKAKLAEPLRVPGLGKGTARLVVHADWQATLQAAIAAARRAEARPGVDPTVRYTVSGVAYLFGGLPVPFSRSGEFAWPRAVTSR